MLIARQIQERIKKNQNFIGLVTGPTGSGKSFIAMRFGEMLDPDFNVDRICFTVQDFLELLNDNLPPGSVIVMDEAGLAASARRWMSTLNQTLSYLFQSHRYLNHIYLFTLPTPAMLDVDLRRLSHAQIETIGINYGQRQNIFKYFNVEISPRSGKIYYKRPIVWQGRKPIKIRMFRTPSPSEELVRAYEEKKARYLVKLRDGLIEKLSPTKGKTKTEMILKEFEKGKLTTKQIAKKYNCSPSYCRNVKASHK